MQKLGQGYAHTAANGHTNHHSVGGRTHPNQGEGRTAQGTGQRRREDDKQGGGIVPDVGMTALISKLFCGGRQSFWEGGRVSIGEGGRVVRVQTSNENR